MPIVWGVLGFSSSTRHNRRQRRGIHETWSTVLLTGYQFVFYTLFQVFRQRASERESVWKAGVVVAVMETWIAMIVLLGAQLLRNHRYWPPRWVMGSAAVLITIQVYVAFDRHERWRSYAERFRHYSRQQLAQGRFLVATVLCVVPIAYFALLWHTTTHLPPV